MRKQEYVHVHALLAAVVAYLDERDDVAPEELSTYRALDTRPSSIHESKRNHRAAVLALSSAIESELDGEFAESPDRQTSDSR